MVYLALFTNFLFSDIKWFGYEVCIFYEVEKVQYLVYICVGMYGMFKLQYDFCFYFSSLQIILPTQSLHNGKQITFKL